MRSVILLSNGVDPVSGRPAPPPGEVAAIGLALSMGGAAGGLHAGAPSPALRLAAGHGLDHVDCLDSGALDGAELKSLEPDGRERHNGEDAVVLLADCLKADPPDLVLAGRQACGGEDSGLLPYLLAERLGWPLLSGVIATGTVSEGWLSVTIGLPQGARRQARVRLPCILCAHDAAPAPPFVFDRARRVTFRTVPVPTVQAGGPSGMPPEETERAYRARPRLISTAAPAGAGKVLEYPDSLEAAHALRNHLRALGVLGLPQGPSSNA